MSDVRCPMSRVPTAAGGSQAPRPHRTPVHQDIGHRTSEIGHRTAFTLLELLLVLVLLGFMSAIAAARLGGMRSSQAVEQAAQQVFDQGLRCRQLAADSGQAVRLRLDLADPDRRILATIQLLAADGARDPGDGHDPRIELSDGSEALTVSFIRNDGVSGGGTQIDLLFLPDARCEPAGRLTFANRNQGRSASVLWHTGAQPPTLDLTTTDLGAQR
jgi:prepilin-type N-terminal cleavage/methylation domain-containing protein